MRKSVICFISLVLVSSILSGCGGSSKSSYAAAPTMAEEAAYDYATDDIYAYEEPAEAYDEGSAAQGIDNSVGDDEIVAKNRKIIKTVNLTAETEEFDTLISNITKKVESLGGYLENSDISGRSLSSGHNLRYANLTARIPSKNLNAFVCHVEESSNITYKTESAEDVTLNYADTEARISSLRTEQKRLNELMETAEDVDTLIMLEQRLTEVRYEIESYESRLRTMDDKIDYSTVYVTINEVEKYTPDPEVKRTVGERIAEGFSENLVDAWESLTDLFVGFVVDLPYLLLILIVLGVFGLIVFGIVKLIIFFVKKSEAKRIKKMPKNAQPVNNVNASYQDLKPVVLPGNDNNKQNVPVQDAVKPSDTKK